MGGEYTFLAPPLGVWRLCGVLRRAGHDARVFDPNCCEGSTAAALRRVLADRRFDLIGVSTTGMTLRYDLALAHLAKRLQPEALLVAGGMEATFDPETLFRLSPFDLVVLGEGELPLLDLLAARDAGLPERGVPGTAFPSDAGVRRVPRTAAVAGVRTGRGRAPGTVQPRSRPRSGHPGRAALGTHTSWRIRDARRRAGRRAVAARRGDPARSARRDDRRYTSLRGDDPGFG
jgi:radical SAM superfamily enzyme YgiQ (UPF0313 family)